MVSDYQPVIFQKPDDEEEKPDAVEKDAGSEGAEGEVAPVKGEEPPAAADENPEAAAADAGPADMGEPPVEGEPAAMEGDEGPDTSWMEEDGGAQIGPIDAEMVTNAILEGTIAVKDFHAIQSAIEKVEAAAHPQEAEAAPGEVDPQQASDPKAPPAAAPGEAMQREEAQEEAVDDTPRRGMDPEKAALMGRVEALEADKRVREEEAEIVADVDAALESLEGRSLGTNPKDRFTAFRREHGKEAFGAYVGELTRELPPSNFGTRFSASNPSAFDFGARLPDEVLAFQKDGTEAVSKAAALAKQWHEAKQGNVTSVSLERFLSINMNGVGAL